MDLFVGTAADFLMLYHRDVKNEMSKLQNQWEHQAGLMSRHLDQLSNQLQLSQRKVEMLQQTVYHSKDDKLVRLFAFLSVLSVCLFQCLLTFAMMDACSHWKDHGP